MSLVWWIESKPALSNHVELKINVKEKKRERGMDRERKIEVKDRKVHR
jgi:hypothetical protein